MMLAALCLTSLCVVPQAAYEITDLGPLWGDASHGIALNDAGAVTGYVERVFPSGSQFDAFHWWRGVATDLGHLSGWIAMGLDLNSSGQVVGYSSAGPVSLHGFLWEGSGLQDLGTFYGEFSRAQAINDRGWIAGVSQSAEIVGWFRANHPVAWIQGTIHDLPTFGGSWSEAVDLNDAGVVVGYSQDPSQVALPFRFTVASGLQALPELVPGGGGQARAIEDGGAIAGFSYDANGDPHAVLWSQGQVTDLGTLGGPQSFASGVNHDGIVVGNSGWAPGGGQGSHAFVWQAGTMYDLNALALPGHPFQTLTTAGDINDAGQITGTGETASGAVHAFLATPRRFLLLGPERGVAGATDSIEVRNATPGATLTVVVGSRLGAGPPIPGCPGLRWGVADPRPLATVTADAAGNARISLPVPGKAAGHYLVVQAADPLACTASTRLAFRYRP